MPERWRVVDALSVAIAWSAASALAVLVSGATVAAGALPAALAGAVAIAGHAWPLSRRLAAATALVAAAAEPAAVLPWTVAAICVSLVVLERARALPEPDLGELERDLERCRRRGEPATVLYLDMEADAPALRKLLGAARITDSLVVRRSRARSHCEVYGLLDGADVTRARVEQRFTEVLAGVRPTFAWASYPQDGLTLEVLLEHACGTIAATTTPDTAPARVPAQPPALEPALILAFDGAREGATS